MEATVARLVTCDPERAHDPLYDTDARTGATIEVFYADPVLAASFGMGGAGWYLWSSWPGTT
jgi:hypothetical protein